MDNPFHYAGTATWHFRQLVATRVMGMTVNKDRNEWSVHPESHSMFFEIWDQTHPDVAPDFENDPWLTDLVWEELLKKTASDCGRWVLVERSLGLPSAKFYCNSAPDVVVSAETKGIAICVAALVWAGLTREEIEKTLDVSGSSAK